MKKKHILYIIFLSLSFSVYGKNPKVRNYEKKMDRIVKKTDNIIRKRPNSIQIDTLEFESKNFFTFKTDKGNSVLYGCENCNDSILERKSSDKLIVYSKKGNILKIRTYNLPISMDEFIKRRHHIGGNSPTAMYFENNKLILLRFSCWSRVRMGSCGEIHSTYLNYFKNNKYYSTVRRNSNIFDCSCGFNYIVSQKAIESLITKIENYLAK